MQTCEKHRAEVSSGPRYDTSSSWARAQNSSKQRTEEVIVFQEELPVIWIYHQGALLSLGARPLRAGLSRLRPAMLRGCTESFMKPYSVGVKHIGRLRKYC